MKDAIITLYDWLAISEKPEKSDIIFLFGGPRLGTPQKGLELYHQGYAPKIIAAGNTGTFDDSGWGRPNADVFAEYLLERNVPKDAIIFQNISMNTLEDVTLFLFLMRERNIHFASALLVSRPVHQRRCFATFRKQSPGTKLINVPCDEMHPSALDENMLKEIGRRCAREYERLHVYAEKGDIQRQEFPSEINEAYQELKATLNFIPISPNY